MLAHVTQVKQSIHSFVISKMNIVLAILVVSQTQTHTKANAHAHGKRKGQLENRCPTRKMSIYQR